MCHGPEVRDTNSVMKANVMQGVFQKDQNARGAADEGGPEMN